MWNIQKVDHFPAWIHGFTSFSLVFFGKFTGNSNRGPAGKIRSPGDGGIFQVGKIDGVSRVMGVPQARWMVYFMKNPFINGWFRGTPILGHLHIYIYISFVIVSIHSMSSLYLEYIWTFISRKILCCVFRNWYLGHWVLLGDALSPKPQRQDVKTTPGVSARHCGGALGPFGEYRNGSGRPGNRWGICCLAIVFCLISRCCSHKSLVA